ncbi:hypothetical protein EVAR_90678_1, partial [Eumeta japonica]
MAQVSSCPVVVRARIKQNLSMLMLYADMGTERGPRHVGEIG